MDAAGWDRRYLNQPSPWTDRPNAFLAEAVAGLRHGTVLDLACGEGRNTLWLAAGGWRAVGIDFSQVAVDRANERARSEELPARFEVRDLRTWEPEGTFDLVTMVYLHLRHEEMEHIVGRASAAVAAGGTLFAIGHHAENLERGHGGPQDPSVLYTEAALAGWFQVPVIRAERVVRSVTTDAGPRSAVDALVIGRAPAPPTG